MSEDREQHADDVVEQRDETDDVEGHQFGGEPLPGEPLPGSTEEPPDVEGHQLGGSPLPPRPAGP